ncbi:MAG: aminodeoxychorismate/anthranilate synthase component II [Thermomicrobiales bacterium]
MILLIDNYDSFTFNLYQFLSELGAQVVVHRNDQITLEEIDAMRDLDGVVVSPGPCTPREAGISINVIEHMAGKTPVLGVCLGHQSIGEAFGGDVVRAPQLMHGKTSMVHHDGKGIFQGLPDPFVATRYHSLIVDRETLPEQLEITAETEDGIIMGLQHREYPIYGVQFHPESILTPVGKQLLGNFLATTGAKPSTAVQQALIGY